VRSFGLLDLCFPFFFFFFFFYAGRAGKDSSVAQSSLLICFLFMTLSICCWNQVSELEEMAAVHVVVVRLKPNFHNRGSTPSTRVGRFLTQLRPTERTLDRLYAQAPSPVVIMYLNSVFINFHEKNLARCISD
jgi:hypothetical protein